MKSALFGLVVFTVLAGTAPVQAVDSPWPMFRHDLNHSGRTPYTGPSQPNVKWVFTGAEDGIACSPTIGEDGTIYVGAGWYFLGAADSSLYAINPDGSLKWRFKTDGGVFSSPAIGPDGTIYFGSLDFHLYAVEDAGTHGNLKWKTNLGFWVYSSPAIGADGTIYVGCINFQVYALDPAGNIKWSYPTGRCVFSSPAIGPEGEVYIGSKIESLFAFEDSLTYAKLRWRYNTGQFYDGYMVDSSPAIGSDGTLYVGTDPYDAAGQDPVPVDTVFYAINPDGTLKWIFPMNDGAESSPAIGPDGTIYIGSYDSTLYAISDQGNVGVEKWRFSTNGAIDGSPTVDGCGIIYIGSRDSTMYAINPDGTLRWSFITDGEIESSPTIDDNGILYVGTMNGSLYALGSGGPDVGVVSIDLPPKVTADSTYHPKATVSNYRSGLQSFDVSCLIDLGGFNIYGDTLTVSGLAETTHVQVIFEPWTIGPDTGIVYDITVSTLLNDDENHYNDILMKKVRSTDEVVGILDEREHELPNVFALDQSYPNPFNPTTTIVFDIAGSPGEKQRVQLDVYDIRGKLVRRLVDSLLDPGSHRVVWDGRDNAGQLVSSGVYLYTLRGDKKVYTRKMVLMK